MLELEEKLIKVIKEIIKDCFQYLPHFVIETPRDRKYGDLSTNVALQIASHLKENPFLLAEKISQEIEKILAEDNYFEKIEVIKPGFINFYLSWNFLYRELKKIIEEAKSYGRNELGRGEKVLIEFVSANPTGPLSIAHGRQAVFGNALANILEFSGYRVAREYYVNDEGRQIELLADSLQARILELEGKKVEFPSDGYRGQYLIKFAEDILKNGQKIEDKEKLKEIAVTHILDNIKKELSDFGISYNRFRSQKKLQEEGLIEKALSRLRKRDCLYEKEGALWFKSKQFGDDRDRVVRKSDGSYTYFASDIAYHMEKFQLGYDWLINIWGPDHHGYIPRVKASLKALGYDPERLKVIIIQLATIYKNGKPVPLSTREGKILTFKEVLDEVGKDATIYFLLTRKSDSHLDFDLDLARQQSPENPVYYIQYAHARIESIIKFAQEQGYNIDECKNNLELVINLNRDEERQLLRILVQFPKIVKISTLSLEPSLFTSYLLELASSFHSYYNKYRVVSEDQEITKARILLSLAIKYILSNGLGLLGISAPKKM